MTPNALLLLALLAAPARDTVSAGAPQDSIIARDTTGVGSSATEAPRTPDTPMPARVAADTLTRRRRAVEVSDAYATRLRIHRYASYTLIPLFAAQSIAGNQMFQSGKDDPKWAKTVHSLGAGGLAALFTVNTVTGAWNLWDSRATTENRTVRWLHAGLMLASDAGFTYAGVKLGPDAARGDPDARRKHRKIAFTSMGVALVGYSAMLFGKH